MPSMEGACQTTLVAVLIASQEHRRLHRPKTLPLAFLRSSMLTPMAWHQGAEFDLTFRFLWASFQ